MSGIWIKAQNGKSLVLCRDLRATKDNGVVANLIVHSDYKTFECLGSYSTEEKALKVLDMIQSHISEEPKGVIQTNEDEWLKYNQNAFQMPQDDEVKV